MDRNEYVIEECSNDMLGAEGIEMEENFDNCWGEEPPNSYINRKDTIDGE